MLKIQVIIGSVRQNRFADKPAKWISEEVKKNSEAEVEVVDLLDWNLPLFNEPISPSLNKGKYENEIGAKFAGKIGEADGYIFVTPEYNHGYSSALKNAIDYVYMQWNNKPVAFLSYGGISGGTRAVQQLRQVVIELQMVPIRNGVHIPMYWKLIDESGNLKTEALEIGAQAMISQLLTWTKNLKKIREESSQGSS